MRTKKIMKTKKDSLLTKVDIFSDIKAPITYQPKNIKDTYMPWKTGLTILIVLILFFIVFLLVINGALK